MTAKYSALLRQHYYTSTIGSNRPNPKLWQPNIWSHVIAIRQANEYSGSLPHQRPSVSWARSPRLTPLLPALPEPLPKAHPVHATPLLVCPFGPAPQADPALPRGHASFAEGPRTSSHTTSPRAPLPPRDAPPRMLTATSDDTCSALTVLSSVEVLHKLRPELESAQRPLNADGFERVLRELGLMDDYGDLMAGLRDGFDFGIPPLRETRTPPNHLSATENEDVLERIAASEIEKGRWAGPFTRAEVETVLGPFQSSPMGLIPKSNGDWRLVQDLSYPR
ncbi:hypothetical protein CF335_g9654, partial [Tilletia laevis]